MVQYKDNDTSVYGLRYYLYSVFVIEPDLVNERVHYTSVDGRFAISFGSCGLAHGMWLIEGAAYR